MGNAIGQILPLAVGVAISPIPIVAVVLMLVSRRGRVNGPMFVAGWVVGLALVGAVALLLAGPADASDGGDPATWVSVVQLVLGGLLVFGAARQWQARPPEGTEPPMPKWMTAIDSFTPAKAAGSGLLFGAVNPKNLLLAVAAAVAIAQTGISGGAQAGAYAVFTAVATVGVAAPVVVYFALGDEAKAKLDALRVWMVRNGATIMSVLLVVIGAKLIGDAISGLTT
jgi:threonine/homoserine/homoserine lactone efflux protein